MSATVVVTRNASPRTRGFLASSMLEIAPGVYVAPDFSVAVRERVWGVLESWFVGEEGASVVMVWQSRGVPGGLEVRVLGSPPIDLVAADGVILAKRAAPEERF